MTKELKIAVLAAAITIIAALPAQSQAPFCIFFDSTSTFDGKPVPVGSIIEAFDPQGVSCGKDTVLEAGKFGFMPVTGDDPSTNGKDEGAVTGDTISFTINGRTSTLIGGDPTWEPPGGNNIVVKEVKLTASSISIAISGVVYPGDTLVGFNTTVRVQVGVRNDGDGLDYYGVTANTSKESWIITPPQTEFVYAEPNDTAFVYFDIEVPLWPGSTFVLISYSVFSYLDTSQHVDSSFNIKSDIALGIDDDIDGILPTGFVLEQNYPNPFNPTTNIAYTLPIRTDVRIEIYDILGRQIESIDLGNKSAGEYIYQFDGSLLASGVYFYRLLTETHSESKKMMLVK